MTEIVAPVPVVGNAEAGVSASVGARIHEVPPDSALRDIGAALWSLWASGRHFSVLGFTTHVKAYCGTPVMDPGGREIVWNLPAFNDLLEALLAAPAVAEMDYQEASAAYLRREDEERERFDQAYFADMRFREAHEGFGEIEWLFAQRCESPIEMMFLKALYSATDCPHLPWPEVQHEVPPYRLDFAFPNDAADDQNGGGLAVELDGHDFHKTKQQRTSDARRDRALARRGWHTMRFTGSEVFSDADACVNEVRAWLAAHDTEDQSDGTD